MTGQQAPMPEQPIRGLRLIVGLVLVTVVALPGAHVALLSAASDTPARDLLFLIFYIAIAATLAANVAVAFTLSLTATLATPEQPARSGFARIVQQDALPPGLLIATMLAPMAILLLGFGAWLCTSLYRAGGNLLFLMLTALDLSALSAALLALALMASIALFQRARRAAAETPDA